MGGIHCTFSALSPSLLKHPADMEACLKDMIDYRSSADGSTNGTVLMAVGEANEAVTKTEKEALLE